MPPPSSTLSAPDWIALAAHALAHRWPNIPPAQLEDVAADLYRDEARRALSPAEAMARWLRPLQVAPGDRAASLDRLAA